MIDKLTTLGLSEKEAKTYLYLVEYGISWASEIAKHLNYPKSTVNFLADNLWKRGYVSKSIRANTYYYEVDISFLEALIMREKSEKEYFLQQVIPSLRQMNANTRSKPKIVFFDGKESCQEAYMEILSAKEVFYEFWAHTDLVSAFGEDFMRIFIAERVRKGIFCDAIVTKGDIEELLHKDDDKEKRNMRIFDTAFGKIGSSISIYDNKVLILNLADTYTGVRIENQEFADTMKTIFRICKG